MDPLGHPRVKSVLDKKTDMEEKKHKKFNTKAFCIVFFWGWVIVLPAALIFIAFTELPIKTVDLLSDLLNTFQILILLVSLLVTYKIVSLTETDISRFLKRLRKMYKVLIANHKINGEATLSATQSEVESEVSEPANVTAMKKVRRAIKDTKKVDDVEAAACLVAELIEVVVHKLPKREDAVVPPC